jgi:hypothetical protein
MNDAMEGLQQLEMLKACIGGVGADGRRIKDMVDAVISYFDGEAMDPAEEGHQLGCALKYLEQKPGSIMKISAPDLLNRMLAVPGAKNAGMAALKAYKNWDLHQSRDDPARAFGGRPVDSRTYGQQQNDRNAEDAKMKAWWDSLK